MSLSSVWWSGWTLSCELCKLSFAAHHCLDQLRLFCPFETFHRFEELGGDTRQLLWDGSSNFILKWFHLYYFSYINVLFLTSVSFSSAFASSFVFTLFLLLSLVIEGFYFYFLRGCREVFAKHFIIWVILVCLYFFYLITIHFSVQKSHITNL